MSFQNITGQISAKRMLQNSLRNDKISHAYIFSGPVGTGRKQAAYALAMAIYCSVNKDDACGHCLECRKVEHGNHPDLSYIEPDGASIKIDQIRELQKEFAYRATSSETKIYILDQADKMTVQAANSLLKFLEEPVSRVVAILITENGQALLSTIQSRAQWISFTPMPRVQMEETLLSEGHPAILVYPAVHLTSGLGAARELIQSNLFAEMRSVVIQLVKESLLKFPSSYITLQQKLTKTGLSEKSESLFDLLILWLKDMVRLSLGKKDKIIYIDQLDWMNPVSISRNTKEWIRKIERAVDMRKRLRYHANSQLTLEKMLAAIQEG